MNHFQMPKKRKRTKEKFKNFVNGQKIENENLSQNSDFEWQKAESRKTRRRNRAQIQKQRFENLMADEISNSPPPNAPKHTQAPASQSPKSKCWYGRPQFAVSKKDLGNFEISKENIISDSTQNSLLRRSSRKESTDYAEWTIQHYKLNPVPDLSSQITYPYLDVTQGIVVWSEELAWQTNVFWNMNVPEARFEYQINKKDLYGKYYVPKSTISDW